jgi:hypothetical protein
LSSVTPASQLYLKFDNAVRKGVESAWVLAVFEGSPEGTKYSWCSDCVAASGDLKSFLADYGGIVKLMQFKVGSKREWEADDARNPFKTNFPYLSALPTAVLFRGRQDVARTIAPRRDDLLYLVKRAETLESLIKDGSWVPPHVT